MATLTEDLAGRYTRFLLSYNTNIGVYLDEVTGNIGTKNLKKSDSSVIKLNKEGDDFVFKIKDKYICLISSHCRSCDQPSLFMFEELPFGFRVIHGYKCLTAGSIMTEQDCDYSNKLQTFVFDLSSELYCKENKKVYENTIENPITKEEATQIVELGLQENNIQDPETKDLLKELFNGRERAWSWNWGWPTWNWPSFDWC